jgi:hypothetical protein
LTLIEVNLDPQPCSKLIQISNKGSRFLDFVGFLIPVPYPTTEFGLSNEFEAQSRKDVFLYLPVHVKK